MKYIIVSDIHLQYQETPHNVERRQIVERFLYSLKGKIDGLVLAGDIFDFWMEWKSVFIKNYFPLLKVFSILKENGCRLIFITGNHDFWIGSFFHEHLDFEVYRDVFMETINEKKVFISHGNLYTKNDTWYHLMRTILHWKSTRSVVKLLHPDLCLKMISLFSRSSGQRTIPPSLQQAKEKGLREKAYSLATEFELIIMGHTHHPQKIEFGRSVYVNCGDWITHHSYCYFDEEQISLRSLHSPIPKEGQ